MRRTLLCRRRGQFSLSFEVRIRPGSNAVPLCEFNTQTALWTGRASRSSSEKHRCGRCRPRVVRNGANGWYALSNLGESAKEIPPERIVLPPTAVPTRQGPRSVPNCGCPWGRCAKRKYETQPCFRPALRGGVVDELVVGGWPPEERAAAAVDLWGWVAALDPYKWEDPKGPVAQHSL